MYNFIDFENSELEIEIENEELTGGIKIRLDDNFVMHFSKAQFEKLQKTVAEKKVSVTSRFNLKVGKIEGGYVYTLMPRSSNNLNDRIFQEWVDNDGNFLNRVWKFSPSEGYKFNWDNLTWYRTQEYKQLCEVRRKEMDKALNEYGALTADAVGEIYDKKIRQLDLFPF